MIGVQTTRQHARPYGVILWVGNCSVLLLYAEPAAQRQHHFPCVVKISQPVFYELHLHLLHRSCFHCNSTSDTLVYKGPCVIPSVNGDQYTQGALPVFAPESQAGSFEARRF
jgi:hypothetical protein